MGLRFDRDTSGDFEAVAGQANHLARIVGEQPDFAHTEVRKDLRTDAVFAKVHREAEPAVGFDRVEPLLLQLVGMDFRRQADATALLPHVNEHAGTVHGDLPHRLVQLRSAIAPARSENVSRQAFAVHAHQHGFARIDAAHHQRQMVRPVGHRTVKIEVEVAEFRGQVHALLALDQLLAPATVGDEIADRAHFQAVLAPELQQVGQAGHRPVLLEDLTDHPGRIQPRQTRQIHRRLGMARAPQHPALARLQGKNVPRLRQVARPRLRAGQHLDRAGTVARADTRGDTARRINRHREIRPVDFTVVRDHPLQAELPGALLGDRRANKPPAVFGHEIDGLGRDLRGGQHEVPLVFPLGVVGHDHELPRPHVAQNFLDRIEHRFAHRPRVKQPAPSSATAARRGRR